MRDSLIIREDRYTAVATGQIGSTALLFPPSCLDVPLTSDAPGVKESSLRAGKMISSCTQGFRFPSVGCLVNAAAWLDGRGRLQKKKTPFLRPKA